MKKSLFTKIYVLVGIILFIFGLIILYLNLRRHYYQYEYFSDMRIQYISQSNIEIIEKTLEFGLELTEITGLDNKFNDIIDINDDIVYIILADKSFNIIVEAENTSDGLIYLDQIEEKFFEDLSNDLVLNAISHPLKIKSPSGVVSYIFPIYYQTGEIACYYVLGFDKKFVYSDLKKIAVGNFFIGLIILSLFYLFLFIILKKYLNTPLKKISIQIIDIITKKDFSKRIKGSVPLELEEIKSSFNKLLSFAQQAERELKEINKSLKMDIIKQNEKLKHANKKLRNADRMKDEFLSMISHELRTPLTSIRAYTETVIDKVYETEAEKNEFLNIVITETDKLTKLINELLEISKLEAGKMNFEMEYFPFEKLTNEVKKIYEKLFSKKNISFKIIDKTKNPKIYGDYGRLYQVLSNLLNNAFKYTPASGKVTFKAGIVEKNQEFKYYKCSVNSIFITVSDTGIGIKPENYSKVWAKFFQEGEIYTNGVGLGLSIAKRIVEKHRGIIDFNSKYKKGSTFYILIPISFADNIKGSLFTKKFRKYKR